MTSAAFLAIATAVVLGIFVVRSTRAQQPLSGDGQVIEQLRKAGSDLSRAHEVEFFLYFPTQAGAEAAAAEVAKQGFAPELRPRHCEHWPLKLVKSLKPTEQALLAIRAELSSIASRHGGEYDGWGSPVVPRQ
jgi:regulator of RNase E activity RraB